MKITDIELVLACVAIAVAILAAAGIILAVKYQHRLHGALKNNKDWQDSHNACNANLSFCVKELVAEQEEARRLRKSNMEFGMELHKANAKLLSYTTHPNEVVRMALYPKQKLVVSTPGCLVAGGGAIIDFEGALELDGEVFQMENPVKMRGKWSSEGLVMFPLDPTQDIPAMDKLEVFIYAV